MHTISPQARSGYQHVSVEIQEIVEPNLLHAYATSGAAAMMVRTIEALRG